MICRNFHDKSESTLTNAWYGIIISKDQLSANNLASIASSSFNAMAPDVSSNLAFHRYYLITSSREDYDDRWISHIIRIQSLGKWKNYSLLRVISTDGQNQNNYSWTHSRRVSDIPEDLCHSIVVRIFPTIGVMR